MTAGDKMEPDYLESGEFLSDLPLFPPLARDLLDLVFDEGATASDLVRCLVSDPSLTAAVLELADEYPGRSSFPIATLHQAMAKIGLRRLKTLALAIVLKRFFTSGAMGELNCKDYWTICLYRGLMASIASEHVRSVARAEGFLAGFLMESGLPVMFATIFNEQDRQRPFTVEPLEKLLRWERKRYGLDHRQVGEAALTAWGFPERIIAPVEEVDDLNALMDASGMARVCHTARMFSLLLCDQSCEFSTFFTAAESMLGMKHQVASDLVMVTFDEIRGLAPHLGVKLDMERDFMGLMKKAETVLGRLSESLQGKGDHSLPLPTLGSTEKSRGVLRALQAVAHEIRNPLMAVGGFSQKLATMLDPASKEGEYARIILEEGLRLEKTLTEMAGASLSGKESPSQ